MCSLSHGQCFWPLMWPDLFVCHIFHNYLIVCSPTLLLSALLWRTKMSELRKVSLYPIPDLQYTKFCRALLQLENVYWTGFKDVAHCSTQNSQKVSKINFNFHIILTSKHVIFSHYRQGSQGLQQYRGLMKITDILCKKL